MANQFFDILEIIQFTLGRLLYKYELNLSDSLKLFTKDFDRIDDNDLGQYIFKQIKQNKYRFGQKLDE